MFYKFRCAVARFMYGRNGMDQMNQALLRGYLVILVAQLIFSLLRLWIARHRICESLLWVLMVFHSVPNVLQKPDQAPGGEPEVYGLDLEGPEQRRRGQGPPGG